MRPKLWRQINGRKQTFEKRIKLAVVFVVIIHISNDSKLISEALFVD
jgi:hypothetical protein